MRSMVTVLATAVCVSLLACGVAAASITLFEEPLFHPGSVDGQSGVGGFPWKSAPDGAIPSCNPNPTEGRYDQEVERNGLDPSVGFGQQSLRMSNLCGNGEFFNQTYSPRESLQVGEDRVNKVFIAEFAFMSKTPTFQPGLFLSVSPDSGEGSRMSWVGLEDTSEGIRVTAADTPKADGEFVNYDLALLKDRTVPHTIRFWIKVNRGPDNDLVRIAVDDRDVGQCFATWENYYRTAPEQAPPPNANTPADINSLQFRSSVQGPAELATSGGYLFDNVSITPSNGPGPPGCPDGGEGPPPVEIDKTTQTQFAQPGDLITYRITARNRGDAPVPSLRTCDQVPRALKFVRSSVRLHRAAGRRLCRTTGLLRPGHRTTFRATFRLRANLTAATVTNGATTETPVASPPSSSPPDAAPSPGAGVLPEQRRRRADRDEATIGVRRPGACAAALHPRARAAC